MIGGNPVDWFAQYEKNVTHSTPESETYAADMGGRRLAWLVQLLQEMIAEPSLPVPLYIDCSAAIHWCIRLASPKRLMPILGQKELMEKRSEASGTKMRSI